MHKKTNSRTAGILLPLSSISSPYGIGSMGKQAYKFIDFLTKSGQKCWQLLPLGPTSYGDSPYQSFSAFAGNPYFIDLDTLITEKLITKKFVSSFNWGSKPEYCDYEKIYISRFIVLKKAFEKFIKAENKAYEKFKKKNRFWLEDYTLYMAVKNHFENKSWLEWDEDIRLHREAAVKHYKKLLSAELEFWAFLQFKFYEQWKKLKAYANENGIRIIGDIPIYVATDSADVWANHEQYLLDENHKPTLVAGCPPDYFSESGQLWGNAIYDWSFMKKDGFSWWKSRISFSASLYDTIRIDHFIGI
ncbi:MAG: 4-alpha-glucanotransferase, partial [Oscillospiraceae bacterium]